jgi:hypothetical protein
MIIIHTVRVFKIIYVLQWSVTQWFNVIIEKKTYKNKCCILTRDSSYSINIIVGISSNTTLNCFPVLFCYSFWQTKVKCQKNSLLNFGHWRSTYWSIQCPVSPWTLVGMEDIWPHVLTLMCNFYLVTMCTSNSYQTFFDVLCC